MFLATLRRKSNFSRSKLPRTFSRFVLERLIWICRSLGDGPRILLNLLVQILYSGVQLRVAAGEGGVGKIVDHHIRVNSVAFDQPFAFRPVNPVFGGGGDPVVC